MHWCSYRGESVVVLMRARGVDVNARANGGWTPLHSAVGNVHAKVVRELIEVGGANVNARANNGATPMDVAVHKSHDAAAAVLRAHDGVRGGEL